MRLGSVRVKGADMPFALRLEDGPVHWPILGDQSRGTRFIGAPGGRIRNPPGATGIPFWSVNPFIGCEFGCSYCYARDTHRWTLERRGGPDEVTMGSGLGVHDARTATRFGSPTPPASDGHRGALAPRPPFESRIPVKQDAARRLAQSLDPARLGGLPLVIGTATDPYQPAERQFRITRQILEVLAGFQGLHISLITKSPLVTRDVDVLARLAARHRVSVHISLSALDPRLLRRLEARTPPPRARLRALARLIAAGVPAGLLIAPVLPDLTDGKDQLAALATAARAAGARWVHE